MFEYIIGKIEEISEKNVVIQNQGIGYMLNVPRAHQFTLGKEQKVLIYNHWNAEHGPSMYGFFSQEERALFLLIIQTPKIGPSIALSILNQMTYSDFIECITSSNTKALSSLNGIGAKKAEQLVIELKDKIQKLLSTGQISVEKQGALTHWHELSEVLTSLNYSKQEVGRVTQHLAEKYAGQNYPLDQLIRSALAFLSATQG